MTLQVYAGSLDEGLFVYTLEPDSGFALVQTLPLPAPSYMVLSDRRSMLYAVTHTPRFEAQAGSGLVACHRDRRSGRLSVTSKCLLPATNAAYVALDRSERFALVAFTLGGAAGIVRLDRGGEAGILSDIVWPEGKILVPLGELVGPKIPPLPAGYCVPHAAEMTPDNRVLLVPDLGLDRLYLYRLDVESGRLTPAGVPWIPFPAGSGPRHLCFDPLGSVIYVLNELSSTICTLAWPDGPEAPPRILDEVAALPSSFERLSAAADIHLHPSGRFLYSSNRGHDSISVFAVKPGGDHRLELLACIPCGGAHPRSFALSEDGRSMVVSNRDSNNLVAFDVDPRSGLIEPTGAVTPVTRAAGVLVRTGG